MARQKNENNVYEFTCKVTGKIKKTNPKQFHNTVERYGVTDEILKNSYVTREGRKQIADEKLTVEQAVQKYDIHPQVAAALKCTIKSAPIKVEVPATDETTSTEAPTAETPVAEEVVETPAPESQPSILEPAPITA